MPASGRARGPAYGSHTPLLARLQRYDELESRWLERENREQVIFSATIHFEGGSQPAEIRNLSKRGFGAQTSPSLRIGTHIRVELPLVGIVEAHVRWGLCDRFGAVFVPRLTVDPELIYAASHQD
jgi:hypothetical protein